MTKAPSIAAEGEAQAQAQLAAHWRLLTHDLAASKSAPLSRRKAWLVAVLLDHLPDRIWQACLEAGLPMPRGAADLLAYRAWLGSNCSALADIFALVALAPDGPRLHLLSISVPAHAVAALPVEDFMISLYNNHHIQHLMLTTPAGPKPVHDHLTAAMDNLAGEMGAYCP